MQIINEFHRSDEQVVIGSASEAADSSLIPSRVRPMILHDFYITVNIHSFPV